MSIPESTNCSSTHQQLNHHPVFKSLTPAALLYALIWQNWWQDQGTEEEVVSKLWLTGQESPCLRLIPSWDDFTVTLAACVFHHSAPGVFPVLQPSGDRGHVVEVSSGPSLTSPPIATAPGFPDDRKDTSLIHWWVQRPSPFSHFHLSLSLRVSVALPIFPSASK